MRKKRLLCLDVDGTLVDEAGHFYRGGIELGQLRGCGFVIGIASARPSWALERIADGLGGCDFIVSLQGAHSHLGTSACAKGCLCDTLYPIPPSLVGLVWANMHSRTAVWTYTATSWYANCVDDSVNAEARIVGRRPDLILPNAVLDDVLKLIIVSESSSSAQKYLASANVPGVRCSMSNASYIEIVADQALPAKGLPWAANSFQVEQGDCVAVGDGLNDAEMLAWSGLGVTFTSSPSTVKSAANAIFRHPRYGGLIDLKVRLERWATNGP